jgi:hypothetical protein
MLKPKRRTKAEMAAVRAEAELDALRAEAREVAEKRLESATDAEKRKASKILRRRQ